MILDSLFEEEDHNSVRKAFTLVSPAARTAVEEELIPQLLPSVEDRESLIKAYQEGIAVVENGFKEKTEAYTRLISYKTLDQSDEQYRKDLLECLREWAKSQVKVFKDAPKPHPKRKFRLRDLF